MPFRGQSGKSVLFLNGRLLFSPDGTQFFQVRTNHSHVSAEAQAGTFESPHHGLTSPFWRDRDIVVIGGQKLAKRRFISDQANGADYDDRMKPYFKAFGHEFVPDKAVLEEHNLNWGDLLAIVKSGNVRLVDESTVLVFGGEVLTRRSSCPTSIDLIMVTARLWFLGHVSNQLQEIRWCIQAAFLERFW